MDEDSETITLEALLIFATGASSVPAMGFQPHPTLCFQHPTAAETAEHVARLPSTSTCALELKLPVAATFESLAERLVTAVKNGQDFSLC